MKVYDKFWYCKINVRYKILVRISLFSMLKMSVDNLNFKNCRVTISEVNDKLYKNQEKRTLV